MSELPSGQAKNRRRGERRSSFHVNWSAVPRLVAWVPLALVLLALAGLVLTPIVLRERTREMRSDMRAVADPTRLLLGDLRLGLARENSLAQRFALEPRIESWQAYYRTVAHDDTVLTRLGGSLRSLGRDTQQAVDRLDATVGRWREVAAVDGRRSPEELIRRTIERGATYEDLLRATLRVDTAVVRAMQTRRDRVDSVEGLELQLTVLFVVIGCVAAVTVLVLTLRGRHLRRLLRRRAEEETTLRRLAGQLSGALTVSEVAELTVGAALQSSRIGGAYVTSAKDEDHLVVLAARGTCAFSPSAELPMPEWLRERRNGDDPRIFTTEIRASGAHILARDGYDARSLLVVPMRHERKVIGTLALASAGGRRSFGDSAVRYGRALGDLAAVAMHRAAALERERNARTEAEGAVRTRDAVVSIVSHDLRNPLTAILGGADYLLELMKDAKEREIERAQLTRVKHAAVSMNRLIGDLLDVTRLESGPLPIQGTSLSMLEVVDEVVELFENVMQSRRITLERAISENLPPIWGDRDRLEQALSNVLGNAVKFTPSGGRISIRATATELGVEVAVRDSGPGIQPEHLPHLFDRFWQATQHDRRGLGLGLSIVKGIVEAHGGEVRVSSAPRNGTTVSMIIPRRATNGSTAVEQKDAEITEEKRHVPPRRFDIPAGGETTQETVT